MTRPAGGSSTTARPRAAATGMTSTSRRQRGSRRRSLWIRAARVHDDAGFYDSAGPCDQCDVPYCRDHWHVTASGTGTCPQGHTKSLDPH